MTPEKPSRFSKAWWWAAAVVVVAVAALAISRVGVLDLPSAPSGLTLEAAGLANLPEQKQLDDFLHAADTAPAPSGLPEDLLEAARLVKQGMAAIAAGEVVAGLETVRQGIRLQPDNLVLANAYRMATFRLSRDFLKSTYENAILAPQFPPYLADQPIAFFKELNERRQSRETKLHLALAWVDHMLLFPALEVKAPSSVEAVNILTDILDHGNPGYVPALFARGLNHLHRPARLVWPEAEKTPKDAAAKDIGLCVAVGRKTGVGSARLQSLLALALGDAYVKTGRYDVARSWWQIAQNLCHDQDVHDAAFRRFAWQNEEILDRLEEDLDRSRSELDHPMTDLAMMWN